MKGNNVQVKAVQIYMQMRRGDTQSMSEVEKQRAEEDLQKIIKVYLNEAADKVIFAVHLIGKYQMHKCIPIVSTCEQLFEMNLTD